MGMAALQEMSLEEFFALPDDGLRHELLNGVQIVTPAPVAPHEIVRAEINHLLRKLADARNDTLVLGDKAEIRLNRRNVVSPDIVVFKCDPRRPPLQWEDYPIPMLAVEVLSPSTANLARGERRATYLALGIEEYWIVDLDGRSVERWRPGFDVADVVTGDLEFTLTSGMAGSIELPAVFALIER